MRKKTCFQTLIICLLCFSKEENTTKKYSFKMTTSGTFLIQFKFFRCPTYRKMGPNRLRALETVTEYSWRIQDMETRWSLALTKADFLGIHV